MATHKIIIDQEAYEKARKFLSEQLLKDFPEHEKEILKLEYRPGLNNTAMVLRSSMSKEFSAKVRQKFPRSIF